MKPNYIILGEQVALNPTDRILRAAFLDSCREYLECSDSYARRELLSFARPGKERADVQTAAAAIKLAGLDAPSVVARALNARAWNVNVELVVRVVPGWSVLQGRQVLDQNTYTFSVYRGRSGIWHTKPPAHWPSFRVRYVTIGARTILRAARELERCRGAARRK